MFSNINIIKNASSFENIDVSNINKTHHKSTTLQNTFYYTNSQEKSTIILIDQALKHLLKNNTLN